MIERVRISQFYDGRKTDGVLLGLFTYGRELMVRRKTVAGGKSPECANNVVEEVEEVLLLLPLLLLLLLQVLPPRVGLSVPTGSSILASSIGTLSIVVLVIIIMVISLIVIAIKCHCCNRHQGFPEPT